MGLTGMTVGKWRKRYRELGLERLYEEYRPGRPRTFEDDTVAEVINRALQTKPTDGSTHWSARFLAARADSKSQRWIGWLWLAPGHDQQRLDVVHHGLQSRSNRPEPSQAQQVQGCGAQRGHRAGTITPVAVGILMELGVANPVPALNAPAVSHQSQQGFWRGAQAGQKQVSGAKRLAVTSPVGDHLHNPAGADPGLGDVRRGLFRPQRPSDVTAVADLVIACHERDVPLSLELAADLAVQRLLIGFDCQQEVGPLLLELPKSRNPRSL
jgi:hypothetical protein